MFVHRSNRAERLLEELADLVARAAGGPIEPEYIVVQGRGMERWLALELARKLGVWANAVFLFPRAMVQKALGAVLGPSGREDERFPPEAMLWSLARLLPELKDRPGFGEIRRYLAEDVQERKLFQLAVRLARLFDRYAIYRPEMLHRWEAGRESGWQAVLWRALVRENGTAHMADLLGRFSKEARNLAGPPEALPRRLSLFGVSAMPPSYLGVLSALASLVEVHLFMLSASQAEWDRIQAQNGGGHPLLANLGKLQRDFQTILHQTAGRFQGDVPLYETPAETGSALSVLQREILEDLHRGPARPEAQPSVLDPADDSISIHSCHGPTRELEVLHDRIVSFLEADRSLQPQDVVVMAPDIEAYAPLIDAVFGSSRDERPFLPYRISDRSARQVHGVAAAFLRLLDLLPGRMPAPAVLDLLDLDVVRERFSIRAEGLAQIREWVSGSQIRWGVDERHRAAAGQPACRENTWTFGLDRLLLGYAMPGEGRDLFCGVLPFDDLEGTQAPLLGSFVDFCETLFFFREQFTRPRTVGDWQLLLTRLLDRMIACTEQNAHQHQSLRETLARIARNSALGRFRRELPWDTLQPLLAGELSEQRSSRGFLSGGVTFCQLVPMRSIPFPVVCLLGMNDGEFPRTPEAPSFDLMARHPAVGDRTPLEDDRSLFLEAILAARRKLVITYTGQSVKNNRPLPPSVLVSSLLDALQESFILRDDPAGEGVAAHLVVKHPLQPFSPRYFDYEDDSRLFSYATGSCEGAQSLVGPPHPRRPFLSSSLAEEPDRSVSIRLDELVRFFRNPARRFLERSLGLFLAEEDETLRDREPLELNGLEKWDVVTGLLRRALEGEDLEQAFASVKASGTIPPGTVGRCLFHDLQKDVRDMVRLADRWRQEERLDDLPVQVSLAGTWITGEIRDLWPGALLEARMSRLGRAWELDLWIRHLVLCLCAPESHPRITVALGRNDEGHGVRAMMFRRVGQPESILRELLDLYQAGQQVPLPFFPDSARAYVEKLKGSSDEDVHEKALARALEVYRQEKPVPGAALNPYVRQVFGETNPLSSRFQPPPPVPQGYLDFPQAALKVFQPLLAHRQGVMEARR